MFHTHSVPVPDHEMAAHLRDDHDVDVSKLGSGVVLREAVHHQSHDLTRTAFRFERPQAQAVCCSPCTWPDTDCYVNGPRAEKGTDAPQDDAEPIQPWEDGLGEYAGILPEPSPELPEAAPENTLWRARIVVSWPDGTDAETIDTAKNHPAWYIFDSNAEANETGKDLASDISETAPDAIIILTVEKLCVAPF